MKIFQYSVKDFQSKIQENKDWNSGCESSPSGNHSSFRATSKRTRIETPWRQVWKEPLNTLSEQHPREQGLKPVRGVDEDRLPLLSEQHPREQGLKLAWWIDQETGYPIFQSNIQENKDWNFFAVRRDPAKSHFQSNIQENKDWNQVVAQGPT